MAEKKPEKFEGKKTVSFIFFCQPKTEKAYKISKLNFIERSFCCTVLFSEDSNNSVMGSKSPCLINLFEKKNI